MRTLPRINANFFFLFQGKTTCMVGLFSLLNFLLSGALAGGNAVNAPD
jgi:hypothetical protein